MAIGIGAGAAIAGGLGLLGQGTNAYAQGKTNRKTRDYNREMWKQENIKSHLNWQRQNEYNEGLWNKQNEYNERMWHMMNQRHDDVWNRENEYNSPQAQMARFKEAGLNPHLIYGQSNMGGHIATGGLDTPTQQAAQMRSSPAHQWSPRAPQFDIQSGIMSILQLRNMAAQTNNLEALNTKILAETAAKEFDVDFRREHRDVLSDKLQQETNITGTRAATALLDLQFRGDLNEAKLRVLNQQEKYIKAQIQGIGKLNALRDLEIGLNAAGITKSDPIYWRMAVRFFESIGVDSKSLKNMAETLDDGY